MLLLRFMLRDCRNVLCALNVILLHSSCRKTAYLLFLTLCKKKIKLTLDVIKWGSVILSYWNVMAWFFIIYSFSFNIDITLIKWTVIVTKRHLVVNFMVKHYSNDIMRRFLSFFLSFFPMLTSNYRSMSWLYNHTNLHTFR